MVRGAKWLSVTETAGRLGVGRNAVHDWIGCGHIKAEESHRDGRGIHHQVPESEVVRLEARVCGLDGCDEGAPGPSGYCCGAHKQGDQMRGQPRPEVQKYPGQACQARSCEDCGRPLGGKRGIVQGYLIAEGGGRFCRSCAQRRRWVQPDEGLKRWLDATDARRTAVHQEIKRLQREGWLTTSDVVQRKAVDRSPSALHVHVAKGHVRATPHVFRDNELIPAGSGETGDPVWFLYRETDIQTFEEWLATWAESGDWRRRGWADPEQHSWWERRRHGTTRGTGRRAAAIAAKRGTDLGRSRVLRDNEIAIARKLHDEGWGYRRIATTLNSLRTRDAQISHMAVSRALGRGRCQHAA